VLIQAATLHMFTWACFSNLHWL